VKQKQELKMTVIKETIEYLLEYKGSDKTTKCWPFTDLASAQEIYEEKASEGKKPKLFIIREITTKEQVEVAK
jgi:hypothetical protein